MGNIINIDKLIRNIINIENLTQIREKHKSIAFCTGCYDVLHSGHVAFFEKCKKFADILIVGIGSDKVIKELKGENRPINPEKNRLYLISSLNSVDYVILNEEEMIPGKIDFYNIIKELKPDVFILNEDDSAIKEKKELCDSLKIELKLVPRMNFEFATPTSSTEIIKKLENGTKENEGI